MSPQIFLKHVHILTNIVDMFGVDTGWVLMQMEYETSEVDKNDQRVPARRTGTISQNLENSKFPSHVLGLGFLSSNDTNGP